MQGWGPPSPPSGQGRHCTCAERLLVGQRSRNNARPQGATSPRSLHFETHRGRGVRVHLGEDPRLGQMWKKKQDNWPEGRHRPGRTALHKRFAELLTRRAPHPSFPGVQRCLASVLAEQRVSLCAPHLLLCYISDGKLRSCVHSLCLCDRSVFH